MNGQQEELAIGWQQEPIREGHLQQRRERMNGWVTHFRGQGVCVCVWMQVSIHSCGKRMQTIRPVKISSLGHLSTSHKAGNGEMEGTGRKERAEEEEDEGLGTQGGRHWSECWFCSLLFLYLSPPPPSTLQHRETLLGGLDGGGLGGGLVFQARQSSHTSLLDHCQTSQRI